MTLSIISVGKPLGSRTATSGAHAGRTLIPAYELWSHQHLQMSGVAASSMIFSKPHLRRTDSFFDSFFTIFVTRRSAMTRALFHKSRFRLDHLCLTPMLQNRHLTRRSSEQRTAVRSTE